MILFFFNLKFKFFHLQQANTRFTQGKGTGSGAERESLLKKLAAAHDAFFEINNNLNEGQKVRPIKV